MIPRLFIGAAHPGAYLATAMAAPKSGQTPEKCTKHTILALLFPVAEPAPVPSQPPAARPPARQRRAAVPVADVLPPATPLSPIDHLAHNPAHAMVMVMAMGLGGLEQLVGDDEESTLELFDEFRLARVQTAEHLRQGVASGDLGKAAALGHRLKSSSRSVGALELGELCQLIESAGKGGDRVAMARNMVRFEAEQARVMAQLEIVLEARTK